MEEYNLCVFLMVTHSPIGALPLGLIITSRLWYISGDFNDGLILQYVPSILSGSPSYFNLTLFAALTSYTVFKGISAHGRLNVNDLFLAHKRPWALIQVGAYSGRFVCPRNWLTSAHGRLFGWAHIPMNTVYQHKTYSIHLHW